MSGLEEMCVAPDGKALCHPFAVGGGARAKANASQIHSVETARCKRLSMFDEMMMMAHLALPLPSQ